MRWSLALLEEGSYRLFDALKCPLPQGWPELCQIFLHQAGEQDALAEIIQLPFPAFLIHNAVMVFGQAGLLALDKGILMPGNEMAKKLPCLTSALHPMTVLEP